ncbi:hypothetical protein MHYP_G00233470 [Metynnis hypsauchen]
MRVGAAVCCRVRVSESGGVAGQASVPVCARCQHDPALARVFIIAPLQSRWVKPLSNPPHCTPERSTQCHGASHQQASQCAHETQQQLQSAGALVLRWVIQGRVRHCLDHNSQKPLGADSSYCHSNTQRRHLLSGTGWR